MEGDDYRGEAMDGKHLLADITGTVDQELLLRNEYLVTENRILRNQLKGRIRLSGGVDAGRAGDVLCLVFPASGGSGSPCGWHHTPSQCGLDGAGSPSRHDGGVGVPGTRPVSHP